jgi:hypothetical protein
MFGELFKTVEESPPTNPLYEVETVGEADPYTTETSAAVTATTTFAMVIV